MGSRGPQRTPTSILESRGSKLAAERSKQAQPPSTAPEYPPDIDATVEAVWLQVINQLREIKTLASTDGLALERYCRLVVDWRKAQNYIDENGFAYTLFEKDNQGELLLDVDGQMVVRQRIPHPEVGIRNKANADLLRLEQQFGLTWASRASLEIPADSGEPVVETRKR
jgi:P27 family predicted phage terminase small subunit